jgi:hypothetical protein
MDDELSTASNCREQATYCLLLADRTNDDRVRELLHKMGRMWSKLASEIDRLGGLRHK